MISSELMQVIREGYALSWEGIHGPAHWARVREYGLRLAELSGADPAVVELFAMLHDSKRQSDGRDADHGPRAAAFAHDLNGSLLQLNDRDLGLLAFACTWHTAGLIEADVTVQTCWDADRLDLWRIGTEPRSDRLCTAVARDPTMIQWARRRVQQDRTR